DLALVLVRDEDPIAREQRVHVGALPLEVRVLGVIVEGGRIPEAVAVRDAHEAITLGDGVDRHGPPTIAESAPFVEALWKPAEGRGMEGVCDTNCWAGAGFGSPSCASGP